MVGHFDFDFISKILGKLNFKKMLVGKHSPDNHD